MKTKIKMKLVGSNKTQINVQLDQRLIPLYGGERRCEIPAEIWEDLITIYNKTSSTKNNRSLNILIEVSGDINVKISPVLIKEPAKITLLDKDLVDLLELNKLVNHDHVDWWGKTVTVPPRFCKVDKLIGDDAKFSLRKVKQFDKVLKDVSPWYQFVQKWLCKYHTIRTKVEKTTYQFRLYTTNVIHFMDYYNVYVAIDNKKTEEEIYYSKTKSKGLKLIK